jgi:uncharacterized protein
MNHETYYQEGSLRFSSLSAQQVAHYLRTHPDFLLRHEMVLADIEVVHHCGDTLSLIEYQVQQLRQKNQTLTENMQQTVRIAKDNERLFMATQRLMLLLLQAKTFSAAVNTLYNCMRQDFHVDNVRLLLVGMQPLPLAPIRELVASRPQDAALLAITTPQCHLSTTSQQQYLFGAGVTGTGSTAIVPLGADLGVLALGSRRANHFTAEQDTLFLQSIGDLLALILPRLLHI